MAGEQILEWYGGLRTRRVDLVGDYAGPETFLIEGDSLLLHCFSDPSLDFSTGFQLLHAVYNVESFLQGLRQRKCNFHVVFFDEHQNCAIPSSAAASNTRLYLLARAVVIRHLQSNVAKSHPTIRIHNVPSIQSEAFKEYLAEAQPYFVMAHDGADPSQVPVVDEDKKTIDVAQNGAQEDTSKIESSHQQKIVFRSAIFKFLNSGYSVALINGTDWVDTKVMSQVIERPSSMAMRKQNINKILEEASDIQSSEVDESISSNDADEETFQDSTNSTTSPGDSSMHGSRGIVLNCLGQILKADPSRRTLVCAFLLHHVLLGQLPLSKRRFHLSSHEDQNVTKFLNDFAALATRYLSSDIRQHAQHSGHDQPNELYDLVDGRLFTVVLHNVDAIRKCMKSGFAVAVEGLEQEFEETSGIASVIISHKPTPTTSATHRTSGSDENTEELSLRRPKAPSILPFSSAVFDKHLASIHIDVGSDKTPYPKTARIFQEVTHWHNHKKFLDVKVVKELDEKAKKRANRRNQFFMAEMQAYAASLTNAAGKVLDPEVITATTVAETSKAPPKKENRQAPQSKNPAKQKAGKSAGKAAVMENVAAKKAQMADDNTRKALEAWQVRRRDFDAESNLPSRYRKSVAYLKTLNAAPALLRIEVLLYQIQVLLEISKAFAKETSVRHSQSSSQAPKEAIYALLWTAARNLANIPLNQSIIDKLSKCLNSLKLPKLQFAVTKDTQKLTFEPNLSVSEDFAVSLGGKKFQMVECGPYMDRNLDSAPDPRVPFEPDAWQREVLDEIDADRSVFVVAPTSAGKTFISFRAMERVLRSSNDGILVYVAPTKALVNQIAAEIQARFKKSYKYAGTSVWAIHTRDYRINNPNGCQVLVTVPAIFQIMLLAPSNANSWSNRLRFAIFDEVHCIGQAEDGIVWEQNILLCPCPIIALSATVGNPKQFYDWVFSTQKSYGHECRMVVHQHRYSDLRKFIWTPPKDFNFTGLPSETSFGQLGLDGLSGLTHIHPVACLGDNTRGMPDDLSLEARDCYILWETMAKHQTEEFPVPLALNPEKGALPDVIRKKDVIQWETNVKNLLREWMQNAHRSPFHKVLNDLQPHYAVANARQSGTTHQADGAVSRGGGSEDLLKTTLPLLYRLHERNALPAILFNYDRGKCVAIGQAVLQQLQEAETKWKAESQSWQATLKKWELYKKTQEKAAAKKPAKLTSKKGKGGDEDGVTKADMAQDMANLDLDPMASFDPDAPLESFSFAVPTKVDPAELREYFRQLKWKGISQDLMDGLRRGIGVHHAGMNRKYRQIVEMLFRKGFLRVVIATGTLALGINMPCATVVFSGDSIFLTALNYRQAAGRAGRRGFDLLGNVVFQGIPENKVYRLMSSRLPDLNGHFPITTTLVLRLFILLTESKSAPYAVKAINSLLSQPRLYLDSPIFKEQVLHHLRFSIEYLRRQDLLSSRGTPINFAGLTSHLYYTDNASFAFNALVKSGYLHELCAEVHHSQSKVSRTLMLVLSHLFGRHQCRSADTEYIERFVKKSPSIVFLPPLPPGASDSLKKHNAETLQTFRTYVETFIDQHIHEPDHTLPLSGLTVGGRISDDGDDNSNPDSNPSLNTITPLLSPLPPTKIRSPFIALSNHSDTFPTITSLCTTIRSGIFLEKSVLPTIDLYPSSESSTPLNAYLYDFYMHGDISALESANGIRKADVWFLLNDFSMVLATIVTSLANLIKLPGSGGAGDVSMMDVVGGGDAQQASAEDLFASESGFSDTETMDSGALSAATTGITTPDTVSVRAGESPRKKVVKKIVKDAWDEEEEGGEGDSEGGNWDDDGSDDDDDSDGKDDEEEEDDAKAQLQERRSNKEIEKGFKDLYLAFSKLKTEFDEKFYKIFA